jgi:hypothetical protein
MTIESNHPTFSPANIAPGVATGFAREAGERIGDDSGLALGRPVTRLEVSLRSGIWAVTKDGQFYGHYFGDQSAFDAAKAAAFAVVASGGAADVSWKEPRGHPGASDQAKGSDVATSGVVRTMEFRPGSARIVR